MVSHRFAGAAWASIPPAFLIGPRVVAQQRRSVASHAEDDAQHFQHLGPGHAGSEWVTMAQ